MGDLVGFLGSLTLGFSKVWQAARSDGQSQQKAIHFTPLSVSLQAPTRSIVPVVRNKTLCGLGQIPLCMLHSFKAHRCQFVFGGHFRWFSVGTLTEVSLCAAKGIGKGGTPPTATLSTSCSVGGAVGGSGRTVVLKVVSPLRRGRAAGQQHEPEQQLQLG